MIVILPVFLDPSEFGSWFEEQTGGEVPTVEGLSLSGNVDKEPNQAV